jgi:NAD(P)-dependent dehydrogenase (short-subunit alcohol dehydrogenase family)
VVSNAGVGSTLPGDGGRMESADGYERRFAVNSLAGFLLTLLLERSLRRHMLASERPMPRDAPVTSARVRSLPPSAPTLIRWRPWPM